MAAQGRGMTPGEATVRQQLERILKDPLFERSERLSSFLRFIVECKLTGRLDALKESVLGTEVFGRNASYDPHDDPVVRINAGRLRGKLAEYYQLRGSDDPVIIALPRGGYVPEATWRRDITRESPVAVKATIPRIVGREPELSALRTAFSAAITGNGFAVMISGEAGVGKTTLTEEFVADLATAGVDAFFATGRCSERLADTEAFVPIIECLDDLLHREVGSDVGRWLNDTAPGWYTRVAKHAIEASGSSESGQTSQERLRRQFVSFFEELSKHRPVVLFFDDVHWADPSTCDLLTYLAERMNRTRLLLLMAYRPAGAFGERPLNKLRVDLERRGKCRELPLSFLTRIDVANYLVQEFPHNTFPDSLAELVHQRTEGNALFMAEMVRYLRDHGVLVEQGGHWSCSQEPDEIRDLIPVGIRSMVRLKVQLVREEDRRILLSAAVQGLQFDSTVVAKVLSLNVADVEERLQTLDAEHDFVRAAGEREFLDGTLSARYRFIHVFYQHALTESLVPNRRAALSLQTARSLIDLTGTGARELASEIALLFEAGRDAANAAEYFLQAARNAARVFAYAEAATLCERGLKALATLPESRERNGQELRFSLIHGLALMASRGYAAPEVEKAYTKARELCLLVGDKRRLVPVLWGLHTCYVNRSDLPSSLKVAQEMVDSTEDTTEAIARVEALHALGSTFVFMGRLQEGRESLERIFAAYPINEHVLEESIYVMDPFVTSLSLLARVLVYSGFLDEALEKAEESIKLAQRLAHPPSLTYAMLWRGYVRNMRGENELCCEDLQLTMEMSSKHDLPLFLEWARIVRGSALSRMGHLEDGIREMRLSLKRQSEMGSLLDRPYCLTVLAEALLARGARDEALAMCNEVMAFTARTECRCYEPETHRIRGEILLAAGEDSLLPTVQKEFTTALELAGKAGCRLLELKAAKSNFRLHRKVGGVSESERLLRAVLGRFAQGLQTPAIVTARELLKTDR